MKRIFFAFAATTIATTGSAQAIQTTFTFNSDDTNKSSIIKIVDGINLTLGSFSDPGDKSAADSDGLALYNPYLGNSDQTYNAFEMQFDQPVKLISYNLKWIQLSSGISTTFAQGLNQSVELIGGTGTYSFSNQFLAQANVPISVTSTTNGISSRLAQINSLTVEKDDLPPATVPGPLPILGFGAAFGFSRRLRHRVAPSPVKVTPADA